MCFRDDIRDQYFDILFDVVWRVLVGEPKKFERWTSILQGAKLGGMTIGNPRGVIMVSIWVAMYDELVGGMGGEFMGLGSACLVISTPIWLIGVLANG